MNFAIRKANTDDPPIERLFGGFRLRSVSLMVLTGFLFSLFLCAFEDAAHGLSDDHHEAFAGTSHVAGHAGHDHEVQQAGDCCTAFAYVATPLHVTDFSLAIFHLLGVLLLSIVSLNILSTSRIKEQFNCTGPPDGCKPTLIANCLWPNAPPR